MLPDSPAAGGAVTTQGVPPAAAIPDHGPGAALVPEAASSPRAPEYILLCQGCSEQGSTRTGATGCAKRAPGAVPAGTAVAVTMGGCCREGRAWVVAGCAGGAAVQLPLGEGAAGTRGGLKLAEGLQQEPVEGGSAPEAGGRLLWPGLGLQQLLVESVGWPGSVPAGGARLLWPGVGLQQQLVDSVGWPGSVPAAGAKLPGRPGSEARASTGGPGHSSAAASGCPCSRACAAQRAAFAGSVSRPCRRTGWLSFRGHAETPVSSAPAVAAGAAACALPGSACELLGLVPGAATMEPVLTSTIREPPTEGLLPLAGATAAVGQVGTGSASPTCHSRSRVASCNCSSRSLRSRTMVAITCECNSAA
mmetsp:Transcript_32781/g.102641  ORF Transcript_32781/g.102641 Transcript_32781/m.102641 type:complete len:363 (+) Transcript_32781:242-1330(+)